MVNNRLFSALLSPKNLNGLFLHIATSTYFLNRKLGTEIYIINRYVCKQKKSLQLAYYLQTMPIFSAKGQRITLTHTGGDRLLQGDTTTSFPQQHYHQESINLYSTASASLVTNSPLSYQQHKNRDDLTLSALKCIMYLPCSSCFSHPQIH